MVTANVYEKHDKSTHALPFESPYFPAFFRLLKWKILDICVDSVSGNGREELGLFQMFDSLFEDGELSKIAATIRRENAPSSPFNERITNADLDEKTRKQALEYVKMKRIHELKIQKRRAAEYFLNKILFNEKGLRIADEMIFNYDRNVYGMFHWDMMPKNWVANVIFKKKFYEDPDEQKDSDSEFAEDQRNKKDMDDPFGMQRLDRVVGCARGNLILANLARAKCMSEISEIENTINDSKYSIYSSAVRSILDEGPAFTIEKEEGEEKRKPIEKWNDHKTRCIFIAFPGFALNDKKERNEQEEWYYYFMEAMSKDPCNRAALFFLNKNYEEELKEIENERHRIRLLLLRGMDTKEEAVGSEVVKEIRPQPADSEYQDDADVNELVLRSYQEELVQPALEGKNCVIVAPTGSGKTEVAIYAALNHIKQREEEKKPARVVMLVPKIPLVGQQTERFLKYCRGRYRVDGFHGSEKSSDGKGRRDEVLLSHIVVMTPQILINMWQSVRQSERLFVCDFSMIIFDEVHKATGAHPYVEISRLVQEWQYEKPQIIGLTASLNVNAAVPDVKMMLESIYGMLAILNAPNLSTINRKENIEELNKHVGMPDDSVELCEIDRSAPFIMFINRTIKKYHDKLCGELEMLSKNRQNCFPASAFRNFRLAKADNFEYFESLLQGIIQDLNRMNTAEKANAKLYTKYLKVYIEARGIVEVMPSMIAFRFMEQGLSELDQSHKLDQFSDFRHNYETVKREITDRSEDPMIVRKLRQTLQSQFETTPSSRVIIFVTQRSTAQRVCDFLNESKIMNRFRKEGDPANLVGFVLGTNNQGIVQQSQREQQETLDKFNNGKLKVIVATSVVEEGLDVAACNLIIKYNCSSGSAIQLVQQRGRARAKNSRSVLLTVSSSVNEKENNALISEKYMRLCVKEIIDNKQKRLEAEVERVKRKQEAERKLEEAERLNREKLHENKIFNVNCTGCNTTFCKSVQIKKIYSNYMAMDPEIWDYLDLVSKRKVGKKTYLSEETQALSTIKCKRCNADVGKAYKMRGVYLPQLDVRALSFPTPSDEQMGMVTFRKWSSVETELFYIGPARQHDFQLMLNAFNNSEANMEKKRLLDFDSQKHMEDIERFRYECARREKEEEKKKTNNSLFPRKTEFSDDEGEKNKEND